MIFRTFFKMQKINFRETVLRRSLFCTPLLLRKSSSVTELLQLSLVERSSFVLQTQKRGIVIGSLGARMGGGDFVDEVAVQYEDGLPVLLVPLPSRRERCRFTLKPLSQTVGDFINFMKEEDGGLDRVIIFSEEGYRIAQSTSIDVLMRQEFRLELNDKVYEVAPPERGSLSSDEAEQVNELKVLLSSLYSQLNLEQYQLDKEKQLVQRLDELKLQAKPLEKVRLELEQRSAGRARALSWLGLAYMGVQFGVLARLTWWEYSWDIMEPVTYFITYATSIAVYGYFLLTQTEYVYPDARDRQFRKYMHFGAKKADFSIDEFNQLQEEIAQTKLDLERLRDPLQLQMPVQQIEARQEQQKERNQPQ